MKHIGIRKGLSWLVVAVIVAVVLYRVKFRPVPVVAHGVARGDVGGEVLGTGTLEARIKTTISPRIQERLAVVLVDQGSSVTSGQLLARLDDAETKQHVAIAEATLAAARATTERVKLDETRADAVLRLARQNHERLGDLLTNNIATQAEFDKAVEALQIAEVDLARTRSAIVEAERQVLTAEKSLLLYKEHLAFTEMRSPFDGLVTRRDRDPGGIVVPGASILHLVATNEIWVSAWVDETALSALCTGQPTRTVFRSEPAKSYDGEVARIGREADRETREFIVDVRVKQLPATWTIGQRAEVFIETARAINVVVVPAQFLHWRDTEPGVVVNDHGRARWRGIALGVRGMKSVEVTQGLSAGEQVVRPLEGQKQPLTDGQRIAAQ